MKINSKKFAFFSLAALLALFLQPISTVLASGSTMSLSPSGQTVTNGTTFTVQVRANVSHNDSGDSDGITALISFPSSRLQVNSLSAAGSSFSPGAQQSFNNSNGTISIFQNWNNTKPQGDLLITTITFRAVATGNAAVSYGSAEVGNDTPATSGANYTVVAAPAAPVTPPSNPAQPSSPSNPSSSSTKPKPSTPSSPTATTPSSPGTAPSATDPAVPGTTNQSTGSKNSSKVTGLPVSVRVVDGQNKPISNASVVINKKTYRTDKKGIISLSLTAGKHEAAITSGTTTKKVSFTVKPSAKSLDSLKTQTFTFVLAPSSPLSGILLIGGIVLGSIAAIAIGLFIFFRLRRRHDTGAAPGNEPIAEENLAAAPAYAQIPEPAVAEQNGMTIISSEEQAMPTYETAEPAPRPAEYVEAPVATIEPAPVAEQIPSPQPEQMAAPVPEQTYVPETPINPPEEVAAPLTQTEPVYPQEDVAPPEQAFVAPPYQPEELAVVAPVQQVAMPAEPAQELQPQPEPEQPHPHNNSVYLDEEEPKDMYEVANEQFHYREHPTQ